MESKDQFFDTETSGTFTLPLELYHHTCVLSISGGAGQAWEEITLKFKNGNWEIVEGSSKRLNILGSGSFSLDKAFKCDCGANAVGSNRHSHWCSMAGKE